MNRTIFQEYDLKSQQGRRRIRIANRSSNTPLHTRNANAPKTSNVTMPAPRAASKQSKDEMAADERRAKERKAADEKRIAKENAEELINRPPDSSSDGEDSNSADIAPTRFKMDTKSSTSNPARKLKKDERIASPSFTDSDSRYRGTARPMSRVTSDPSSSAPSGSQRSSQESPMKRNGDFMDTYGKPSKKVKSKYGSSQSGPASSQVKGLKKESKNGKTTTEKGFEKPDMGDLSDSPQSTPNPRRPYQKPDLDGLDSSQSARKPRNTRNGYQRHSITPEKKDTPKKPTFQMPDVEDLLGGESPLSDPPPSSMPSQVAESPPATGRRRFELPDMGMLDDDLLQEAKAIVDTKDNRSPAPDVNYDNQWDLTMTQRAVCPMCNTPVDPAGLRAFGVMNMRRQEKFCRSHRRKTAKDDWELEGYPEIDWNKMDDRIASHHALIKKLIKGESSFYRDQWEEKVKSGQNRSLKKMTSNYTPGYYGARGQQIISGNIMHKFTPLLKRHMIEDKLMSARGVTNYVQAVLVSEVASRLIREDMNVGLEKARKILEHSAEIGELLHEEVKDTVVDAFDGSDAEVNDDED